MKKLKIISIIACASLVMGLGAPSVYAKDDSGKIDLYQVFSNEKDKLKTEVGSCIYKWSMHLPDDAIIYKSERANDFNMTTKSYHSSVQLEVNKNKDKLTLEEMLYKIQNNSHRHHFWREESKEFVVDIQKDSSGQKYIRIIKANKNNDFFMLGAPEEDFKDYIENRIYISNNYIYNLTIDMEGEFYKQNKEMFEKLASSFKLSFDKNNPYIKELSDSVSTTREYKNTNYGWKIVMSPYWKLEGSPNARIQTFKPVYSDEELNQSKKNKGEEKEFKVNEGVSVKLVASSKQGESASNWAEKEVEILKNNNNDKVYEILKNKARMQGSMKVHDVVVRYKTVTKKPYVVHNMYVIGNGYKYLISSTMKEEKYNDVNKRNSFEKMLNSFTLNKKDLSKYLGTIINAKSLINLNQPKELKVKKYDFKTKVTKSWNNEDYYDNDFYYREYMDSQYEGNISNNEYTRAYQPVSNIILQMSAGLDANEMKETICQRVEPLLKNDEVRMGLANVKIQSGKSKNAEIYYIEKEYNLDKINKFVNENKNKLYDLNKLQNQYEYIIKIGKDTYVQEITIPVANTTAKNKIKINNIWENTTINNVNFSKQNIKWKQHNLQEFDKEKLKPIK
ncbi:hypothetical protein ACFIJ5_01090 [Haloimpatiens sp. FM7330]|uniref:hypothetical protein n=1 Tax=Haloimpatiens sp. FM7330 TaxID=3298610 RepID=UPI003635B455